MKKVLTILLLFLLGSQNVKAQKGFDIFHDFCTDTSINSAGVSCLADTNKFFVFGNTKTIGVSVQHCYLAAFDYSKKILWTKKVLFSERNSATTYRSFCKIGVDRYVLTGLIHDYNLRPGKMTGHPYLYIFNGVGDSIRLIKQIDTMTRMNTAIHYHDGHIITAGGKELPTGDYALVICKYDTLGNLQWKKQYFKTHPAAPVIDKIVMSADRTHYIMTGGVYDSVGKKYDSQILKIDTAGDKIWQKLLSKKNESWYYMDVVNNPGGGYYFASTYSMIPPTAGEPNSNVLYYGKLNEDGDTLWTRKFNDSVDIYKVVGRQIEWSGEGNHLLIRADWKGGMCMLMKIDTIGNIIWYRRPQPEYNFINWYDIKIGILQNLSVTPNSQYLMAGYAYTDTGMMTWITLMDSSGCRYPNDFGCIPASVNNISEPEDVRMYPNPTTDMLYAELPDGIKEAMVSVTDIRGKMVLYKPLKPGRNAIDISGYATGMYFVKLTGATGILKIEKIVKR